MINIFLNIVTILAILSILILIIVFRKYPLKTSHRIFHKIKSLTKKYHNFEFETYLHHYINLIFFIYLSFLAFSSTILYFGYNNGIIQNYLESTNVSNITGLLTQGASNPFENLSIFIILLSGFIVYTYFFGLISENPYQIKNNENRKKYFWFFEKLYFIGLTYTFLIIVGLLSSKFSLLKPGEILFFLFAWFDLIMTLPIANGFEKYYNNYNNLDEFNSFKQTKCEKRIDRALLFFKKRLIVIGDSCSVLIFFLTLEFAYIGYLLEINILCLIFLESSLILSHMWISRINQTPKSKKTIVLKSNEKIESVYITGETNDYFVIISKGDGMSKIMKSSIHQILYPNDNENI